MEVNNKIVDAWTPIHYLMNFALGLTGIKRIPAYSIIISAEIVENLLLRKTCAQLFKEQEGSANILSDIITGIIGYETAPKNRKE